MKNFSLPSSKVSSDVTRPYIRLPSVTLSPNTPPPLGVWHTLWTGPRSICYEFNESFSSVRNEVSIKLSSDKIKILEFMDWSMTFVGPRKKNADNVYKSLECIITSNYIVKMLKIPYSVIYYHALRNENNRRISTIKISQMCNGAGIR